jgi:hypothetical protein
MRATPAFLLVAIGACGPSGPTPISISPGSLSLNAGQQAPLTVSAGGPAACTASGGVLVQAGNSLTYTAPPASAFFEIRCERAGQVATATIAVSGPLTFEYEHAVPDHTAAPTQNLPIFWIYQTGLVAGLGCHGPTWLGGNRWTCEFPLAAPAAILVRVHDGPRNLIESVLNGFYCATIRYNGVAVIPLADTDSGCIARFR